MSQRDKFYIEPIIQYHRITVNFLKIFRQTNRLKRNVWSWDFERRGFPITARSTTRTAVKLLGNFNWIHFCFFFQTSCLIQNNFFNKVHLSFLPIYPKKENWKVKMTNSASSEPMTARGFFNCWLKHEISEAKRFLIHSLIAGEFSRIFLHKFSNPHRGIGSSCCGLAAHSQCCYSQWLDNSCALLVVFELDSIDTK